MLGVEFEQLKPFFCELCPDSEPSYAMYKAHILIHISFSGMAPGTCVNVCAKCRARLADACGEETDGD